MISHSHSYIMNILAHTGLQGEKRIGKAPRNYVCTSCILVIKCVVITAGIRRYDIASYKTQQKLVEVSGVIKYQVEYVMYVDVQFYKQK